MKRIMKRSILAVLTLCGMIAVATSASAYFVNLGTPDLVDVGELDTLYTEFTKPNDYTNPANLTPPNAQNEVEWINAILGTDYKKDGYVKYDKIGEQPLMIKTTEGANIYAFNFTVIDDPEFFFMKIGSDESGYTHYMFENLFEIGWGVVDLGDTTIANVGAISHIGTLGGTPDIPVPEPGTIVLLGAGLLGLGVFGRKRFRK